MRRIENVVVRGFSAVALLVLCSIEVFAASTEVSIRFVDAMPADIWGGKVTTCKLVAAVSNGTKYHIERITFKVGDWSFAVPEMYANTETGKITISSVNLSNGQTCADQAEYLVNNINKSGVYECTMRGVAEGDCQAMVTISTSLNADTVAQIRSNEEGQVAAAKEKIRKEKEAKEAAERAKAIANKKEAARMKAEFERRQEEYKARCSASDSEGARIAAACNRQCRGVHAGFPFNQCHNSCLQASGFSPVSGCANYLEMAPGMGNSYTYRNAAPSPYMRARPLGRFCIGFNC